MINISSVVYRARYVIERALLPRLFKQTPRDDLRRFGTVYGGYYVPMTLLSGSSVCYSAGVGEDISFETELIDATRCEVFAFDPTPRSIEYIETEAAQNPRLSFFPLGLWHRKETLKFFAPEDPGHVSHSVVNLQNTSDYFEAPCDRLSSIMSELGHSRIDMLKLNIEGAQYVVLESIMEDKVPIGILSVAFDQPASPLRIYRTVRALQRHGFDLVKVDSWAYTFVAGS